MILKLPLTSAAGIFRGAMDENLIDDLHYWRGVLDSLKSVESVLPKRYPKELPPENTPGFWWDVYRLEIATRDEVSAWLSLKVGGECPSIEDLHAFLVRRRIEWASQLVVEYLDQEIRPPLSENECVRFLLIESWERDGCLGLEAHAERDGKRP